MNPHAGSGTYQLIVRGELGDRFAAHFEGMRLERVSGTTVLVGEVMDQAHLIGVIQQAQELGLELISVEQIRSEGVEQIRSEGLGN